MRAPPRFAPLPGSTTAPRRADRQRGLGGGRHLGCGRPPSLSRVMEEGGPQGLVVLLVGAAVWRADSPKGRVCGNACAAAMRERPAIRTVALRALSRLRRVSASDMRCLGPAGRGKSGSTAEVDAGVAEKKDSRNQQPLTWDSSAGDARKGIATRRAVATPQRSGGIWNPEVVLVEPNSCRSRRAVRGPCAPVNNRKAGGPSAQRLCAKACRKPGRGG